MTAGSHLIFHQTSREGSSKFDGEFISTLTDLNARKVNHNTAQNTQPWCSSLYICVVLAASQACSEDLRSEGCDLTQSLTEQVPVCQCGAGCGRQFQFTSRQRCEAALLKGRDWPTRVIKTQRHSSQHLNCHTRTIPFGCHAQQ